MKMNVAASTLWGSGPTTLIGSTRMHKAMMDMVTEVVEVVLEAVVVVCLEEVEVKLFAITAIRQDI